MGMKKEITCPKCDTEFGAEELEEGVCPKCGEKYWWEEECLEDFSDCWLYVAWDCIEGEYWRESQKRVRERLKKEGGS